MQKVYWKEGPLFDVDEVTGKNILSLREIIKPKISEAGSLALSHFSFSVPPALHPSRRSTGEGLRGKTVRVQRLERGLGKSPLQESKSQGF
ncbi:hypothetical protein AVEN_41500-1 [Araneus ventricosus]|uniref:Uncharacterized protein n=1 Tax=Araneus ventricosus TaxID=182803 RepID=A0A4Y2HBV5_ARAVE|nr:hypothetical protein AVEN_41500-1 [Araneus ventricosus]